jgi:hypothetical protein
MAHHLHRHLEPRGNTVRGGLRPRIQDRPRFNTVPHGSKQATVQHGATQCNTVQDRPRFDTVQHGSGLATVQHGATRATRFRTRHGSTRCHTVPHGSGTGHGSTRCHTVPGQATVQHGATRFRRTRHGSTRCHTVPGQATVQHGATPGPATVPRGSTSHGSIRGHTVPDTPRFNTRQHGSGHATGQHGATLVLHRGFPDPC